MSGEPIERFAAELPDVEQAENFGYTFFFVGPDRRLPFVTLASSDNDYDKVSKLDREGVYRVNIGVSKETFEALVGGAADRDLDYSELDVFLPHPDYAKQRWVCILSPTGERLERTKELILEAHGIAETRMRRLETRADPASPAT